MIQKLLGGLIGGLLLLTLVLNHQRSVVTAALTDATVLLEQIQGGNNTASKEKAKAVIEKVSKLMELPMSPEPTVATIVDVDKLKEKNSFYNKASNGDFLILAGTRAILYDEEKNIILDVAPLTIQQKSSAGQ